MLHAFRAGLRNGWALPPPQKMTKNCPCLASPLAAKRFCMYDVLMPRKRERFNLTCDADLAREARRYFPALDLNMSAFFEHCLAQFIMTLRPFDPLLAEIEAGKADPAQLKAAMRLFMAGANELVGSNLAEFGRITAEVNKELADTDKK